MNLEESQVLANISQAVGNLVLAGIMSREQAKGLVKPFLPNEDQRNNSVGKTGGSITKQAVSTTSDVK